MQNIPHLRAPVSPTPFLPAPVGITFYQEEPGIRVVCKTIHPRAYWLASPGEVLATLRSRPSDLKPFEIVGLLTADDSFIWSGWRRGSNGRYSLKYGAAGAMLCTEA